MHLKRLTCLLLLSLAACGQPLLDGRNLPADVIGSNTPYQLTQPTPDPSVSPSPTPTGATPSPTPSDSPSPTPTPTASVTPTPTPTTPPGPTPSPIPTNAQGLFAPADGAYTIVANGAGTALDLTNGNAANGTLANLWTLDATHRTQRWSFTLLTNGTYAIANAATGSCIDVLNNLAIDGTVIQEWECLNQPNQQWSITALGGGLFQIRASAGGCLDIRNNNTAAGAQAIERTCAGDVNQSWAIRYAP